MTISLKKGDWKALGEGDKEVEGLKGKLTVSGDGGKFFEQVKPLKEVFKNADIQFPKKY